MEFIIAIPIALLLFFMGLRQYKKQSALEKKQTIPGISSREKITLVASFFVAMTMYFFPPTFMPRWLAVILGPSIIYDFHAFVFRKAREEQEKSSPEFMNNKFTKILIVLIQIVVIILFFIYDYYEKKYGFELNPFKLPKI